MNFGTAGLAVTAYVEVSGVDGSSTLTNSGVATKRLATGTYAIDLPVGLGQYSDRDLIFVQIKGAVPGFTSSETDTNPARKLIYIGSSNTTAIDSDFSVVIFRTLLPPPVGSPA